MPSFFISYRHIDSAGHAGRLYDRLAAEYGDGQVFIDVERIAGGDDFAEVIHRTLSSVDACLVIIGPRWLAAADSYGRRRLDLPNDWIRMEVGAALTRDLYVLPLLVDGATALPPQEALPTELVRLNDLKAMEISNEEFHADVDRVIEVLEERVGEGRARRQQAEAIGPGTVKINLRDGLEYVWVPAGDFTMGRAPGDEVTHEKYDDEKPPHPVRLNRGGWMAKGPVPVSAYHRFAAQSRTEMPRPPKDNPNWAGQDHPIVNVSWAEARDYCAWAGGRLPTEAEWEYAARGGTADLLYPWGNEIAPDLANYADNQDWTGSSPVGQFPANGFGLVDMVGNVWEWVADWYDDELYPSRPGHEATADPRVFVNKTGRRVVRGGSWDSIADEIRISNRGFQTPEIGFLDFGFRCWLERMPGDE